MTTPLRQWLAETRQVGRFCHISSIAFSPVIYQPIDYCNQFGTKTLPHNAPLFDKRRFAIAYAKRVREENPSMQVKRI